ncbi:hypothetical protein GOL89_25085 [Sinorhizobium medicae]|nr:hypothetical protein [Sinorhizobium medicae]
MTNNTFPCFRVHFHDGKTFDIAAANSLIAESKARAAHPGGFVKKIKLIPEKEAR